MIIIVTGGASFIGGNYIRHFLNEHPNDRIICIHVGGHNEVRSIDIGKVYYQGTWEARSPHYIRC